MPESGMWGTAVGGAAAGKEMLDAALGLSEIELRGAHQRYYGAGAQKLEAEAKEQQGMAELMQRQAAGMPTEGSVSIADRMDSLARAAMDAGLVTRSQELAKNASLVRQREASALTSGTTAALNQVKLVRDRAELTGQIFGGATDETTWAQTHRLWEFQTGQPSPYANQPYSSELVERINATALSTKERADAEASRLTREGLAGFRTARLAQHDTENRIREARLALARAREARLAKAGGGRTVSSPGTSEVDQARRLIGRDYTNLEAADLGDAAYSVAAEARALRRSNPALDANVALQQAYNNARAAGDFQTLSRGILGFGKKQGFRGTGKSPETAMSLPKDRLDPKAYQKDRYYIGDKGVIGLWTGTTMQLLTSRGRPLSPGNGRPVDEEDEEE